MTSRMFLATTALSEFWDKNREILCLGSWCLHYDRWAEWEGLKCQVLPSPWDDRKRFYDAAQYLDECGERVLHHLTDYLNLIHGTAYSLQYWRILIGSWLFHYLQVVYDRYVHLDEAFKRYPQLRTITLDAQSFLTPRDMAELVYFVINDHYNLQIFSQLLGAMGHVFPVQSLHMKSSGNKKEVWRRMRSTERMSTLVACVAGDGLSRLLRNRWGVGIYKMGLGHRLMWSLAWRSGLRAIPIEVETQLPCVSPCPGFDRRRNGLASIPFSNEFERLFAKTLPQNFPTLYVEGYHEAREAALRKARIPRVIVSAAGWHFDEPFKFIAAEASARGSKLVAVQHGGGYGIYRFSAVERHERRAADSFLVWGWADEATRNCRNAPSPALSSLLQQKHRETVPDQKDILFTATAHPRYLYRFHSSPVGSQWGEYFHWMLRFLSAIPSELRTAIRFRDYGHDYGHGIRRRITDQFADMRWDDGTSFKQRLEQSRIVVIDHCGTSFLETMVANVPTVMFWDPLRWEVRDEAGSYFENLRSVGILSASPEAAARKVIEIYEDPWSWWGSADVQGVRQRFVDRYALGREDWMDCWVKALNEEVGLSQVRTEYGC